MGGVDEFVAEPCDTDAYYLGEGVRFDDRTGELYWVSVYDGAFFRARVDGPHVDLVARYDLGGEVGAVAPCENRDDGWVVARDRGVFHLGRDGELTLIAEPEYGREHVRMNDGAADPWGRFWVGSMAYDYAPGEGRLFRVDAEGGVETVVSSATISNGMGWSPDRRTMYYVDSGPATLDVFDVDADGAVSSRRTLVSFDAKREGAPDGLCVDANGAVWVALWGGSEVRRYGEDGELLARVQVPASQPSCCAIGGQSGTTLYVTTAQEDLTPEALARQPMAGRLMWVEVGVLGRPLDGVRWG
ncbi:MAG: SMP-30/gluconolactonase/LRE family protein [Acidimicrobiales bacterium]